MTDDEDPATDDAERERSPTASDRATGAESDAEAVEEATASTRPDTDVAERESPDDGSDTEGSYPGEFDLRTPEERGLDTEESEGADFETQGTDTDEFDDEGPEPAETEGEPTDDAEADAETAASDQPRPGVPDPESVREDVEERSAEDIPEDVRKYDRFKKVDGSQYERVNDFLRERTYITAREWAIARLCADFRTETGVEMTKIGENLPELVPFMTDTYTPQAVNQARASFEEKVRKAGATFLYGAMCDFFTAEELDDVMYEATEVAKFLLEVEGVDLDVDEELAAEDRISSVMRDVRKASDELRHDSTTCPECGHEVQLD